MEQSWHNYSPRSKKGSFEEKSKFFLSGAFLSGLQMWNIWEESKAELGVSANKPH
jgi:hypothetical protein